MIPENQISEIKKQLLAQIETGFPADQKDFAKKKIESMNAEELESFLRENQLAAQSQTGQEGGQCIFCSIVAGEMSSYKISENSEAIAVLDIRPASKGHSLIIPKEHIESGKKMPEQALELAEKVSKILKTKLKAKEIKQENANLFGHETINLIPTYDGKTPKPLNSEREPASESDLAELQKLLQIKAKPKIVRKQPKTKIQKEKILLPKRIP